MPIRNSVTWQTREDILGTPTPAVLDNEDIKTPVGDIRPAPWLPIAFTKSDRDRGTEYFVISAGKVVALTRDGFVVPAGYRSKLNKSTATTVLTYTSDDYDQKTIDLTTGEAYAVDGTTNYTALQVAEALVERGLVPDTVAAANPPTSNAHVTSIAQAFVGLPVGICAYDVWKWYGKAEDLDQQFGNYTPQHAIAYHTQHQMVVPMRAATDVTGEAFDTSSIVVTTAASGAGDFPQAGEVWDDDALASLARYDISSGDQVVALALANKPVARDTERTPLSCDTTGVLTYAKSSVDAISREGDYFLDAEVGLLFLHSDTYATLVAASAAPEFDYTHYDDSATGASSERYMYFDGIAFPGMRISIDEESNFVPKGAAGDIFSDTVDLGFVNQLEVEPGPLMTMVKSRWGLSNATKASKMPGTATSGYSHRVTIPDETIADTLVRLVFRI